MLLKKTMSPRPAVGALTAVAATGLLTLASDLGLVLDPAGKVLSSLVQDPELPQEHIASWSGKQWIDTVTAESRGKIEQLLQEARNESPRWRQVNHPISDSQDLPILYRAMAVVVLETASAKPAKPAKPAKSSASSQAAGATKEARASSGPAPVQRVLVVGRSLGSMVALQQRLVESQQSMERDYWRFREAETRYRHLFQSSGEAVLIVDAASLKVLEVNPAAQTLCGPSTRGPKLVGSALTSLFDEGTLAPLQAVLASARGAGGNEGLSARLARSHLKVLVAASIFRQDDSTLLLVRVVEQAQPVPTDAAQAGATEALATTGLRGGGPHLAGPSAQLTHAAAQQAALAAAFLQSASDAIVVTDSQGRVLHSNAAFAVLAQMPDQRSMVGQLLDRWVGRTGVELGVLISNLRQRGNAGLFVTSIRGESGVLTQVEIAASMLSAAPDMVLGFAVRNVERRIKSEAAAGSAVTRSVADLTDLVGNMPLKDIVTETTDLIEQLCIQTALDMTGDKRSSAALLLGLSRQSLYVKLRRFGIAEQGTEDDG